MNFSVLMGKMVIFVVLMAAGYLFCRTGYVSRDFVTDGSKLAINFFTVSTILNSVMSSGISFSARKILMSIAVMTVSTLLCYVLGSVVSRTVPLPEDKRPEADLLLGIVNNVFICLPVIQAAYGPETVFHISMSCLPFNVLAYSWGVWRISRGEGSGRLSLRKFFTPSLIATVAAIAIFTLRIPIPFVVRDLMSSLSGATMPLSMLVVGAALGSVSIIEAFTDRASYAVSFFSLIVSPLLAWLILSGFVTDPVLLKTAVMYAGAPSGLVVTVLAVQYNRNYVFTAKTTLLSTILSMITMPAWVYILG